MEPLCIHTVGDRDDPVLRKPELVDQIFPDVLRYSYNDSRLLRVIGTVLHKRGDPAIKGIVEFSHCLSERSGLIMTIATGQEVLLTSLVPRRR